jgi:DNA-binding NarL/FixJ family response regulator
MAMRTKFIVVDDHPLYRHGVADLIAQELKMESGGEAGNAAEAYDLLARIKPELAIIDISLQGQNGLDIVRAIKTDYPSTASIVLSMHEDGLYGERALKAGARGYVMKHEPPRVLLDAVRTVMEGKIAVSELLRERMMESMVGRRRDEDPVEKLSDRELQVFRLIGKGFGAAEIAKELGLSVKTINAYQDHLKEKLNLPSAAELRKYAIEWSPPAPPREGA